MGEPENIEDVRRRLELQKLQAEIEKFRSETEQLRRQRLVPVAEVFKAVGAVIVTTVAVGAAFTTYRVTQLETKLANVERTEAYTKRNAAFAERDRVLKQLEVANSQKTRLRSELMELQKRAQTARAAALKAENDPSADVLAKLFMAVAALNIRDVRLVYPGRCPPRTLARLRRQLLEHYVIQERPSDTPCAAAAPLTEVRYAASAERNATELVQILGTLGISDAVPVRSAALDASEQPSLEIVFGQDSADASGH